MSQPETPTHQLVQLEHLWCGYVNNDPKLINFLNNVYIPEKDDPAFPTLILKCDGCEQKSRLTDWIFLFKVNETLIRTLVKNE